MLGFEYMQDESKEKDEISNLRYQITKHRLNPRSGWDVTKWISIFFLGIALLSLITMVINKRLWDQGFYFGVLVAFWSVACWKLFTREGKARDEQINQMEDRLKSLEHKNPGL